MLKYAKVYNYENQKLGRLMFVHQYFGKPNNTDFLQTFNIITPSTGNKMSTLIKDIYFNDDKLESQKNPLSIGIAELLHRSSRSPEATKISWIESAIKNKNIGQDLLCFVAMMTQECGLEKILLNSLYDAIEFYLRFGFVKDMPNRDIDFGESCDMHGLVKNLNLPKIAIREDRELSKIATDTLQSI